MLDADIELCVRSCGMCQDIANIPQVCVLHLWKWQGKPWFRVNMDYAGKWILVTVVAHSKYIDAHIMSLLSSSEIERTLRGTFVTHGSPHVIISDNASNFTC